MLDKINKLLLGRAYLLGKLFAMKCNGQRAEGLAVAQQIRKMQRQVRELKANDQAL